MNALVSPELTTLPIATVPLGRNRSTKICVLGLGYVGLPTAALFALNGHEVLGVDIRKNVVDAVRQGRSPLSEKGVKGAIRSAVQDGALRAALRPDAADAFVIAVPTPLTPEQTPDLSAVRAATASIADVLEVGNLVILESTVPVGTTQKLSEWLAEKRPDLTFPHQCGELADVRIAHCPERVLPGESIQEFSENDRVIGGLSHRSADQAKALFSRVISGRCTTTDAKTAEMCKLVENSARDSQIAFVNEISVLCDHHGIDVWHLIDLANRHPRVNLLQPGVGVGGHCIAVDPWFLIASAPGITPMLQSARKVNNDKPKWVIDRVRSVAQSLQVSGRSDHKEPLRIACLGLTFKPDIDDMRESPALIVVEALAREGHEIVVVEPHIRDLPPSLRRDNVSKADLEAGLSQADIICVLVKHRYFLNLTKKRFGEAPVIDCVGLMR